MRKVGWKWRSGRGANAMDSGPVTPCRRIPKASCDGTDSGYEA